MTDFDKRPEYGLVGIRLLVRDVVVGLANTGEHAVDTTAGNLRRAAST